jgi:hypothetical protein
MTYKNCSATNGRGYVFEPSLRICRQSCCLTFDARKVLVVTMGRKLESSVLFSSESACPQTR